MDLLGIRWEGNYFRVAVIQPEDLRRFSRPGIEENAELLLFSIRNIGVEQFSGRAPKPFSSITITESIFSLTWRTRARRINRTVPLPNCWRR